MDMLGNALRGLPVNKKEQPKPLNRYGYPQLAAFKSTKAPGQYSTGTGGQYSSGANSRLAEIDEGWSMTGLKQKCPKRSRSVYCKQPAVVVSSTRSEIKRIFLGMLLGMYE